MHKELLLFEIVNCSRQKETTRFIKAGIARKKGTIGMKIAASRREPRSRRFRTTLTRPAHK